MPFHRWLPAAMVAPTPVSALLHAVAVVKAGVFAVVKVIVYTFGFDAAGANFAWLPYVAGFTIIAASIVALRADNLKRRLAYSTVSQLSYVVLAVGHACSDFSSRSGVAHRRSRVRQDNAIFCGRGNLHRVPQDASERTGWRRAQDALDAGSLCHRLLVHDRLAADRGCDQQVVHRDWRATGAALDCARGHCREHAVERGVLRPDRVSRFSARTVDRGRGARRGARGPWWSRSSQRRH